VIADQRRAAGDHSRRMKWLLTIVVCALLMTVAIGIAQTLLLLRLAHQSTAQEQRIEQMMLNQQATLATLLDTDSSTTSVPVSAQAPAPASPAAATAPAKPADAHVVHAQHAQRRKSAHAH
jgi:flagellar basal body-associated protein FliL